MRFLCKISSIFTEIQISLLDKTTRRAKWCLGSDSKEMLKGHRKFSHVQDTLRPSVFLGEARVQPAGGVVDRYGRHPGLVVIRSPGDREESSGRCICIYYICVVARKKWSSRTLNHIYI